MHTSALFQATDFRYRRIEGQGSVDARFAELFPEYHELDRVGVVSLRAADGIRYVGWMPKLLGSRPKAVCFYRAASPTMRIEGGPAAVSLLERSLGRLDADPVEGPPGVDPFRRVAPGEFLEQMAGCFER